MTIKQVLPFVLILLAVLTGCSTREAPDGAQNSAAQADDAPELEKIDPAVLAQAIQDQVEFQDVLKLAEEDVAANYYNLDSDVVEVHAIYISGTGATAEEVAVLRVTSVDKVDAARAILEERVQEQIFRYQDYLPKELVKLESPVLLSKGDIVVLVLAEDAAAAEATVKDLLN